MAASKTGVFSVYKGILICSEKGCSYVQLSLIFLLFRTEGGAFYNYTKNKKSQGKIFSKKDAKIDHFHCLLEMLAGSASMMKVSCFVFPELFGRN